MQNITNSSLYEEVRLCFHDGRRNLEWGSCGVRKIDKEAKDAKVPFQILVSTRIDEYTVVWLRVYSYLVTPTALHQLTVTEIRVTHATSLVTQLFLA